MQSNDMLLCKSQIGCLEYFKCDRDCQNICNVGGNIEKDDEYSDEEELNITQKLC